MFKSSGLTLFELLICISIITAISLFSSLNAIYKVSPDYVASEIKQAIQYAKTQAIIHKKTQILKPIDEHDWSKGIQLCDDASVCERHWQWPQANRINIMWHGFQARYALIFRPEASANSANGYFLIDNMSVRLKLLINRMGRTRIDYLE